jgi:hypothetical protein
MPVAQKSPMILSMPVALGSAAMCSASADAHPASGYAEPEMHPSPIHPRESHWQQPFAVDVGRQVLACVLRWIQVRGSKADRLLQLALIQRPGRRRRDLLLFAARWQPASTISTAAADEWK